MQQHKPDIPLSLNDIALLELDALDVRIGLG